MGIKKISTNSSEKSKSSIRLLALDQSSKVTGWGLLEVKKNGEIKLLHYGIINIFKDENNKELSRNERIAMLGVKVQTLIDETKPDVIALETPFVGQNRSTALALFSCFGAIILLAHQNGLPMYDVSPAEAKSFVLKGQPWKGKDSKVLVKKALMKQFGISFTSASDKVCDDSDAIAVGITVISKFLLPENKTPPIDKPPKK